MGYGSYKASDWSKLKQSKNISSTSSASEIFVHKETNPKFDPQFIDKREALDSEDHPNSTPIILGLDVTGSMGYLSEQIAKESLNETMLKLYSSQDVDDPALLFAAYGDERDDGVLQVTQFESDIRIAEQLLDLWLVNRGSGYVVPYLLWYFAAEHTKLDAYDKRQKKGFLITIGDNADIRTRGASDEIMRVFKEKVDLSTTQCLSKAQEKFEVMHIFIGDPENTAQEFVKMLPGRYMVITKEDLTFLPEIIISAMLIVGGMPMEKILPKWTELARPVVQRAVAKLTVGSEKKGFFF